MQHLETWINEFLEDRKVYCADRSIQYYSECLDKFKKWYSENRINTELCKKDLKNYILYLRDNTELKNTSINTNYRAVKVFCRWLYEEEYLDQDITRGVKFPKNDSDLVIPLSDQEVHDIDSVIFNQSLALRNYCIFHLMLDCGLRRQEVLNLKHDYMPDRLFLHNSKGEKSRIVLLPDFLYQNLENYYTDTEYVFRDRYDKPITEDCIDTFFQKLKKQSGIKRIHAHLCRHTFATSYLQYGGDMEKLRLLMGHSDYNVLRNYLHLSLVCPDVYKIDDIFFRK